MEPVTDTLFPPACAACRQLTGRHGALCAECWGAMHFITPPLCHACGLPFDYVLGEDALCGRCLEERPPYRQARALLRYDEHSKGQLIAFKYHDKTQLAPVFGRWLARLAEELPARPDCIIPVPLHYRRLVRRRYNQAALLAQALARETGFVFLPDGLERVRATVPQTGLTRRQRDDNMRGAFRVRARHAKTLVGASVLLVDDVMTTGATLNACTRSLRDAGTRDVCVVTIARTAVE